MLLSIMLVTACKGNPEEATKSDVETSVAENAEDEIVLEESFVKFYNQFHEDSLYQWDHVMFPLENLHESSIDGPWTRENWIRHNTFTDMGGMFKRDFEVLGNIVVEKIIDANGFFEMERRFAKLSSGWNLIYYHIENPSINEDEAG